MVPLRPTPSYPNELVSPAESARVSFLTHFGTYGWFFFFPTVEKREVSGRVDAVVDEKSGEFRAVVPVPKAEEYVILEVRTHSNAIQHAAVMNRSVPVELVVIILQVY